MDVEDSIWGCLIQFWGCLIQFIGCLIPFRGCLIPFKAASSHFKATSFHFQAASSHFQAASFHFEAASFHFEATSTLLEEKFRCWSPFVRMPRLLLRLPDFHLGLSCGVPHQFWGCLLPSWIWLSIEDSRSTAKKGKLYGESKVSNI